MSAVGAWSAVLGNLFHKPEKPRKEPQIIIITWITFENKEKGIRVDFSENDKDYIESIRIDENYIKHNGIIFKYLNSYKTVNSKRI